MRSVFYEDEFVLAVADKDHAKYVVDIGAGDGDFWSESLHLIENGWGALCIECIEEKYSRLSALHKDRSNVRCLLCKVNAENIAGVLRDCGVPQNLAAFSVDIDGVDAYVLSAALEVVSPQIIIAEHNHYVPPPVRFCVDYNPDWVWGTNQFFGASVEHLNDILTDRGYGLAKLIGNGVWIKGLKPKWSVESLWKGEYAPLLRLAGHQHGVTDDITGRVSLCDEDKLRWVNTFMSGFKCGYRASLGRIN